MHFYFAFICVFNFFCLAKKTPTLQNLIDDAYDKELKQFHEKKQTLNVNDAVVARMKGHLPWPGRIQYFKSNNKIINCYFFGTHNSGPVGSKNVMPYSFARETVRLASLRSNGHTNGYTKGVQELELEYGVHASLSYLKELNAIN